MKMQCLLTCDGGMCPIFHRSVNRCGRCSRRHLFVGTMRPAMLSTMCVSNWRLMLRLLLTITEKRLPLRSMLVPAAMIIQENILAVCASRKLTDAKSQYSQVEKEFLAIVFGIHEFHSLLMGQSFKVTTDHNPFCLS